MLIHGILMIKNCFQAIILYYALLILPSWTALSETTKMISQPLYSILHFSFFLIFYRNVNYRHWRTIKAASIHKNNITGCSAAKCSIYWTTYHQVRQAATDLKGVKSIGEMASASLVKDNTYWEICNLHRPSFSKTKMYSTTFSVQDFATSFKMMDS